MDFLFIIFEPASCAFTHNYTYILKMQCQELCACIWCENNMENVWLTIKIKYVVFSIIYMISKYFNVVWQLHSYIELNYFFEKLNK
jgi:hypothetical protein